MKLILPDPYTLNPGFSLYNEARYPKHLAVSRPKETAFEFAESLYYARYSGDCAKYIFQEDV
jgi:hypothetical protein